MSLKDALDAAKRKQIERHAAARDHEKLDDADGFIDILDAAIIRLQDTSRRVEDDGFHPSVLGIKQANCMRRAVYLLRGAEKVPGFEARTLRIFDTGHAAHDRLQRSFEEIERNGDISDFVAEEAIKVEVDGVPISGHADGVFVYEGKKILLEIKTCSETVFENRLRYKKPKDEHFAQANVYAHILGCDQIWILYENKNNQEIAIFPRTPDEKKYKDTIKKWKKAYEEFYKEDKLPAIAYSEGSEICEKCDLKHFCLTDTEVSYDFKTGEPVEIKAARKVEPIDDTEDPF